MMKSKKKLLLIIAGSVAALLVVLGLIFWDTAVAKLKAQGILKYTPQEAQELAFTLCSQCHSSERVSKYCFRCGPPLIVVVHNMRTMIEAEKRRGKKNLESFTDAQAVAIAQVWNALVGNWEDTWRRKDLIKLLQGDEALLKLLDTPISERPIEVALSGEHAPGAYKEIQGPPPKTPMTPVKKK